FRVGHDHRLAVLAELVVRAAHGNQFEPLVFQALDDLAAVGFHVEPLSMHIYIHTVDEVCKQKCAKKCVFWRCGMSTNTFAGMGAHQSARSETDTWFTPPAIVDALGGVDSFDLDPCS